MFSETTFVICAGLVRSFMFIGFQEVSQRVLPGEAQFPYFAEATYCFGCDLVAFALYSDNLCLDLISQVREYVCGQPLGDA